MKKRIKSRRPIRFQPQIEGLEDRWVPVAPPAPPNAVPIFNTQTNSTPLNINGAGPFTSTLNISGAGTYLWDVDLFTQLNHTWSWDINMTITSPAGTIVTVVTNGPPDGPIANVYANTLFDDQADPDGQVPFAGGTNANSVTDHPYVSGVTATPLTPEEAFGAFIGEDPNGIWTITISDDFPGADNGVLNSWRLDVTSFATSLTLTGPTNFSASPNLPITDFNVTTSTINVTGLGTSIVDLNAATTITHTWNSDLYITLTSPSGTVATLSSANGGAEVNVFNGTTWDDDANPGGALPYDTNNGLVTDHAYVSGVTATPLVPEEALAAFNGENPNGVWTLRVYDDVGGDSGTLATWSLAITTGLGIPTGPPADLAITKSDGVTTAVPGLSTVYTLIVTNNGPNNADDAVVTDTFPASITSANWNAVFSGGATGNNAGSGNINEVVDIPVGGSITYTVTANISPSANGTLANTASVAINIFNNSDPDLTNNSATDTNTLTPVSDLAITKTNGVSVVTAGSAVVYTIVVSNSGGPSNIFGATVTDTLPAVFTSATWNVVGAGGATSASGGSGTGNINDTVNVPIGGSLTYTVTANLAPSADGTVVNTASVAMPANGTDSNAANNAASDTDDITATTDLSVSVTDNQPSVVAGTSRIYTIIVRNNSGPSFAVNAPVSVPLPAGINSASWTTIVSPGASAAQPSGTGAINTTVTIPIGGSVTFRFTAAVAPDAADPLQLTATAAMPAGDSDSNLANNTATDSNAVARVIDLSVENSNGLAGVISGEVITYTIVIGNTGPSTAILADFTNPVPAGLTGATWSAAATAGSSATDSSGAGDIATTVTVQPGGFVTFTLTGTLDPAATGTLTSTATATPAAGTTDVDLGNNISIDADPIGVRIDLAATITNNVTLVTAGTATSYTIVVTNAGPSTAPGAPVLNFLPASLTGATWTATASAGSSVAAASGSGNINTTVTLLPGGSATFVLNATVAPSAVGTVTNTVTIGAPQGYPDNDFANNSASDADPIAVVANLAAGLVGPAGPALAGLGTSYTILVTNAGPSTAAGASVSHLLPSGLVNGAWTAVASPGSKVNTAAGAGDVLTTFDLLPGGTITVTVSGVIAADAAGTLDLAATTTAAAGAADPDLSDNTATLSVPIVRTADLGVTLTDNRSDVPAGGVTAYTLVVSNAGPVSVAGAALTTNLPANVTAYSWYAVASAGASAAQMQGTGAIATTLDIPVGGTVTFTILATISAAAVGQTVVHTAAVALPAGISETNSANDAASDTDTVVPPLVVDLSLVQAASAATVEAGKTVIYTIQVRNNSNQGAFGARVTNPLDPRFASATWTATGTAGSSAAQASGAGGIDTTVDLAAGGVVTFTFTVVVATTTVGTVTTTAAIEIPPGYTDPVGGNNAASATLVVTPIPEPPVEPPVDPPVDPPVEPPFDEEVAAASTTALGDYNGDGVLDLWFIKQVDCASGTTEIHVLDGSTNFQTFLLQTATALHETNLSWQFQIADFTGDGVTDLIGFKKQNTDSRSTEIHVISGTDWSRFFFQTGTALHESGAEGDLRLGDLDGDGLLDMIYMQKTGTATGQVELHAVNGATGFQSYLVNLPLGVAATANEAYDFAFADFDGDGAVDLAVIEKTAADTRRTELHILDGSSNFSASLLDVATALHRTGSEADFTLADADGDGLLDFSYIKKFKTESNYTEVHTMSGASTFGQFILQEPAKLRIG